MIHQPPAGARDLLPLEVAQKTWISERLRQVFQRWGYQRIITSTLESLDTLMAGGAIERSTVMQLRDNAEGTLGLRPELTASISRASANQMAGSTYPQRLYYTANVFRRDSGQHHGRQVEFYQAGVELLGAGGHLADGEVLLLLHDCLRSLDLGDWYLVLGNAGLTNYLLSPFPEAIRQKVRHCISHLDYVALSQLPLTEELQHRAMLLFDLRGQPADVLQKVAALDLDSEGMGMVNNLKSLVSLIEESCGGALPLILDLSLLQTIDYYTGIVFEVVSVQDNTTRILGQGGRYDKLLELYHPQQKGAPGIGFALSLDDLHSCLLNTSKLPQETLASDWLVIPQTPLAEVAAFTYAQKLRDSEPLVRVELELTGNSPEQIREYARNRRLKRLAWVQEDGVPVVEEL